MQQITVIKTTPVLIGIPVPEAFSFLSNVTKIALVPVCLLGIVAFKLPQQKLLKTFVMGGFSYSIYEEDYYVQDAHVNGAFFVVYRNGQKGSLCSAWMKASRNDSVFTRGTYALSPNRIEFKEVYLNKQQPLDSMVKIFSPDDEGNLYLREVREYKNGVVSKNMY